MKNKRRIKLEEISEDNKKSKLIHYHQCNIGNHGWECKENHLYIKSGQIKDLYCNISPCDQCVKKIVELLNLANFF
jgi:deoxycytidylate deaminase